MTHVDVERIWNEMNGLLGHRVIAVDTSSFPNWEDPRVLGQYGRESYILTPEEVSRQMHLLRLGPDIFANPDPRSDEVRRVSHLAYTEADVMLDRSVYANKPRYWLAHPVQFEGEKQTRVWVDRADLLLRTTIPMQRVGERNDGIPVIHYNYNIHSCNMSYGVRENGAMLQRLRDVGMTIPVI